MTPQATRWKFAKDWPALGAAAVFLAAPFESLQPVVSLPRQNLSSVEAVLAAALMLWAAALVLGRRAPRCAGRLSGPAAALVAAWTVSAWLAAQFPAAAWRFTGRQAVGLLFFFLILDAVDSSRRLRFLTGCACLAGTAVALLGIADFLGFSWAEPLLRPFRLQTYTVGQLARASATLQYPTIAAMYLEIVFALSLGIVLDDRDDSPPTRRRLNWAAAAAIGACLILTMTRAGWIVAAVLVGLAAWAAGRLLGNPSALRRIALLGASLTVLWFGLAATDSSFRLRLTTDPVEWFQARYAVPESLKMETGRVERVPVRVRNIGKASWDPQAENPPRLSYHWLSADGASKVLWDGIRTELPERVGPGAEVEILGRVAPPEAPGDYLLVWDMLVEDQFWFGLEGSETGRTSVSVSGPAGSAPPEPSPPPRIRFLLPRQSLWLAGLKLFWQNPWLGVGSDNFRLVYGAALDLEFSDPTYHAHNLAIEILATTGLAGGLALFWLALRLAGVFKRGLRHPSARARAFFVGVALAATAIALHGMIDYFLEFTPTYLMTWGVLGLAAAADRTTSGGGDADRF